MEITPTLTGWQKVACPLAYHGVSFNTDGSVLPCCQYRRDNIHIAFHDIKKLDQLRQSMHRDYMAGKRHSGCEKCYHEEDLGLETLRTFSSHMIGKTLTQVVQDAQFNTHSFEIMHIEMRLGNLCNLKCLMCGPTASSSVAVERLQHKEKFYKIGAYVRQQTHYASWWQTQEFQDLLPYLFKNLRQINFTGGEPFMIPEVEQWLDNLIMWGMNKTVRISFQTNLTRLTDSMLTKLSKFETHIGISLEGVRAHNDYVRYPSKWQDIEHNFDRLLSVIPVSQLLINHTLQHASAYSLPDLVAWAKTRAIKLNFTMVQGYPNLTLASVPPTDLLAFKRWAQHTADLPLQQQQFVLNAISDAQFDAQKHHSFRQYTAVLDQIRDTNWDKVFAPALVQPINVHE